jgi:RHS repeat-associated protein
MDAQEIQDTESSVSAWYFPSIGNYSPKKSSKPGSDPPLCPLTIYGMNIHPNITPASPSLASPIFDASFDSIESLTTSFVLPVVPTLETTTVTEVALGNHRNGQYSITAMTTSTGAVAERYAYTAYGQPTILNASGTVLTSSKVGNRYTYTGREWDETLGLHHFRARWMSPPAGRFLGRDPIGYADGDALYLDVMAIVGLDPSGKVFAAQCAHHRSICEQLRDIWKNAGKIHTVAMFDRWLAGTGCPSPTRVDIDSISNGASAAIFGHPIFIGSLTTALSPNGSTHNCGCHHMQPFEAELLPISQVVNWLPWIGGNPITDLDDVQYLGGTVRGIASGCWQVSGQCTNSISAGISGVAGIECCPMKMDAVVHVTDEFQFHDGARNYNMAHLNQFATYNQSCLFLRNNCDGYCSQPWYASGTVSLTGQCCKCTWIHTLGK